MCAPLMTLLLYCYIYDIFAVRGGGKIGYSIYHPLTLFLNPPQRYNFFLEYARKKRKNANYLHMSEKSSTFALAFGKKQFRHSSEEGWVSG